MELFKKNRICTYFCKEKQEYLYTVDCRERNTKLEILGYDKLDFMILLSSML